MDTRSDISSMTINEWCKVIGSSLLPSLINLPHNRHPRVYLIEDPALCTNVRVILNKQN